MDWSSHNAPGHHGFRFTEAQVGKPTSVVLVQLHKIRLNLCIHFHLAIVHFIASELDIYFNILMTLSKYYSLVRKQSNCRF